MIAITYCGRNFAQWSRVFGLRTPWVESFWKIRILSCWNKNPLQWDAYDPLLWLPFWFIGVILSATVVGLCDRWPPKQRLPRTEDPPDCGQYDTSHSTFRFAGGNNVVEALKKRFGHTMTTKWDDRHAWQERNVWQGGMHGRGHTWQGVCVAGGGHA